MVVCSMRINIIGALVVGKGNIKYAVVVVDYFTKWVEAEPMAAIISKKMQSFIWRFIIRSYEIPQKLVSNHGKQFDSNEFKNFYNELNIVKSFSVVVHPQSNGQVDAMNKALKHNLKAKLKSHKGAWPKELPHVLWAYHTTARTSTGETPFSMAFGAEAMVLVEVGLSSHCQISYTELQNKELMKNELDLLKDKRELTKLRIASYSQQAARYYNTMVKVKRFQLGDLVFRKVLQNTQEVRARALGPN